MRLFLEKCVQRYEGLPLFTVAVYDLDAPVNFHSYECLYFKQGRDLDELMNEANKAIENEGQL